MCHLRGRESTFSRVPGERALVYMLGQQEPGIWASRATDVRSPLSRSPWCAGLKQSPFFPTSLCAQELNSPHFTAAEVEAQESRPHGLRGSMASGSSGQAKRFYADKRAEAGPQLVGLGFLCLVLFNGLCRETPRQPGPAGVPAHTHQRSAPRSLGQWQLQASSGQLDLTSQKSSHELALGSPL